MAKVNTVFDPVVNVSFEANIVRAFEGEKKSADKFRVMQDKAIQQMLDAFVITCDKPKAEFLKGNAATNPALAQVKAVFMRLAGQRKDDSGNWIKVDAKNNPLPEFISESTANSYASAFWYAFEHNVPFQRDLNNKKSTGRKDAGEATPTATPTDTPTGTPTGTPTAEDSRRAGKVSVINIPELHRSISLVLAQARALNQKQYADKMLEWTLGVWPDFKETVLKK